MRSVWEVWLTKLGRVLAEGLPLRVLRLKEMAPGKLDVFGFFLVAIVILRYFDDIIYFFFRQISQVCWFFANWACELFFFVFFSRIKSLAVLFGGFWRWVCLSGSWNDRVLGLLLKRS